MPENARDVGRLISFGSQSRLAPGRDPEYRDLVARYLNEPDFRDVFDRTVAGMGLEVLQCSPIEGLVLAAAADDSPFRLKLREFVALPHAEDRYRYALVFLAIAAASYPRPEALDEVGGPLPQLSVTQVVRYLNQLAARVAEERAAQQDPDPPANEPLRQRLYQAVQKWGETATTADDRSHPRQKAGMVRRALKWLEANGCADEIESSKDSFRIRGRFRLLVKDALGVLAPQTGSTAIGEALAVVRDLATADAR